MDEDLRGRVGPADDPGRSGGVAGIEAGARLARRQVYERRCRQRGTTAAIGEPAWTAVIADLVRFVWICIVRGITEDIRATEPATGIDAGPT